MIGKLEIIIHQGNKKVNRKNRLTVRQVKQGSQIQGRGEVENRQEKQCASKGKPNVQQTLLGKKTEQMDGGNQQTGTVVA